VTDVRISPLTFVATLAAAAALFGLAGLQLVASSVLGGFARPDSFAARLPAGLGDRLADTVGVHRLPEPLRLVLARQAVASGDVALAERRVLSLDPSWDRSSLEGQIAELRGDHREAVRNFLAAGDLAGLEREEQIVEGSGNIAGAVALQHEIVWRLESDRTQPDALAEAWWRLGLVEETQAYHQALSPKARYPYAARSLDAYEHAVALAPLSEKYLISAGSQELNLERVASAQTYFERARDVDPTSAQAWVGLGEVALYRGDRATAVRYLARARRIDPTLPAVGRLDAKLRS
jgi:tetratricopeptide (TPR) repeat protein